MALNYMFIICIFHTKLKFTKIVFHTAVLYVIVAIKVLLNNVIRRMNIRLIIIRIKDFAKNIEDLLILHS